MFAMITRAACCFGLLVLLLTGCATSTSIADGKPLQKGQGLIAMKVRSNTDAFLNYNKHQADSTFGNRFAEEMFGATGSVAIKNGQYYWVLPVKAGDYMWSKFSMGNMFAWLHATNKFTVKENSITYIGHIDIVASGNNFRIYVQDNEDDMRQHLSLQYPNFLSRYPVEKQLTDFVN